MLRPQGYAIITDPDAPQGVHKERDTFTCGHCQFVVFVKPLCPPEDLGGLCKICYRLVCPRCHAKGTCDPWERQMERMEAKQRFRRSLSRLFGFD